MPRRILPLAALALALAGCTSTPAPPAPAPAASNPASAEPSPVETPALDSISLEARETFRTCGDKSCMVRFDVVPHAEGPIGSDPRLTWRVTYKVVGGVDGVQTGSFTMGKRRSDVLPSELVTIEPPDAKIWLDVASIDLVQE